MLTRGRDSSKSKCPMKREGGRRGGEKEREEGGRQANVVRE
jgi:hypothetical protein